MIATRIIDVSIMDILAQLLPSLKGGLVMALTTLLALYWTTDINLFARLAVIVLTGVVSYLGVLWWTERENLLQLFRLIRKPS